MKIIFDLSYLIDTIPEGLPNEITIESDVIPRKGDTIDFDDNEALYVDETRFRYTKAESGYKLEDAYIFLKLTDEEIK